jgi:hypothetical protein
MSLLRLVLIVVMVGWRPASAEENADFIAISTSYPGGIRWYVSWNSQHAILTQKDADFPAPAIDPQQLGEADRRTLPKNGTYLGFNEIATLIRQLPDQKTLPDDQVRVWDGYGIELRVKVNGEWTTVEYNNPGSHRRIMDAACVGIVVRIQDLLREVPQK